MHTCILAFFNCFIHANNIIYDIYLFNVYSNLLCTSGTPIWNIYDLLTVYNGLDYYLLDGNVYQILILYHENQTGVFEQTVAARKQYFTSK